jgi:hypothetical protein
LVYDLKLKELKLLALVLLVNNILYARLYSNGYTQLHSSGLWWWWLKHAPSEAETAFFILDEDLSFKRAS